MKILHLLSGGIDSTVLLYDLHRKNDVHCLLFNYGQTHLKELRFAKEHCALLNVPFTEVELHRVKGLFARCALTDGGSGSVVVPNRNAVMLHIAASIAINLKARHVTIASNKDDYARFPDCRPQFIKAMNSSLKAADVNVLITAPYMQLTKKQIIAKSNTLNPAPDLNATWSCYKGLADPCNKCLACKLRNLSLTMG